jgi:hypothetical protein
LDPAFAKAFRRGQGPWTNKRPSRALVQLLRRVFGRREALEDAVEAGNLQQFRDAVGRADQPKAAAATGDRDVRGNDLAQPRAVDVVDPERSSSTWRAPVSTAVATAAFSMPG